MRVIVLGALGRMGSLLFDRLKTREDIKVVALVDERFSVDEVDGVCAYKRLEFVKEKADVVVNFASHTLAFNIVRFALDNNVALCELCTGHTQDEKRHIESASEHIPVFFASNTALGIAYISKISQKLAQLFLDADIEIVEAHHSKKADAPSGTALELADKIVKARKFGNICVGNRHGERKIGDVCVHALRMGGIFGEHTVYIDTGQERIILGHVAHSRALYAEGAEQAMRYICTKERGLYSACDLIGGI